MLSRIVSFRFIPTAIDAGLLLLRVSIGISLILTYGYESIFNSSQLAPVVSHPLRLGFATGFVADGICSLLIIVGLATRWASVLSFIVIFVAWVVNYRFLYFGHLVADHGELCVLYLVSLIAIFIAGPGRHSIDARLKD
jgi:putative oxidoreductase